MTFDDWLRRLIRPATLLGFLLFIAGLASLLTALGSGGTPPPDPVRLAASEPPPRREQEVSLVIVNSEGLERPEFQTLALPEAEAARLEAIFAALREVLVKESVWPEALPAPSVYLPDMTSRQRVAVLDFAVPASLPISVSEEQQILASLRNTALRNSVDRIAIIINGKASETFLGHVAIESSL